MHVSNTEMVLMAPKLALIAINAHRPIIPRAVLPVCPAAWHDNLSGHVEPLRLWLLPPERLLCLAAEFRSSEANILKDVVIEIAQPGELTTGLDSLPPASQ
jgi:hypothetical protein